MKKMANADTWERKITKACKEAGTYEPFFKLVIKQLSQIMEMRDNAMKQFKASGGQPVVAHTNKGGHANIVKNPALQVIDNCNTQALAYWRDLGLTSKGYVAITGRKPGEEKAESGFAELLEGIGI